MNSAQRRKQRRAFAPLLARITEIDQECHAATRRGDGYLDRIATLQRDNRIMGQELQKLRESAAHETRKLTENAKRLTPLVAELQIALRHIAQAASIVGADPGHMAVADVASVNELRQKVLAALKGHRED